MEHGRLGQVGPGEDRAGERHGRPVSVCGDAAADPHAIPLLIGVGCRVLSVAPSALDAVRARRPDLVISDIGLPGQDGYELIREIRGLGPERGGDTPAIALTAFARGTDYARALGEGYDLHLAKPIERAALTAAIQELLGGALLRKLRGEPG